MWFFDVAYIKYGLYQRGSTLYIFSKIMARNQDFYAKQAKAAGYPARSVYKLEEIQKKFRVIRAGMRILDIGASPGSWSMFAIEVTGKKGSVVGVDLAAESPSLPKDRYTFIQGDAFEPEMVGRLANLGPFDCILSDAAPATTGNRMVDTARSATIVEGTIDLAAKLLAPDGNLVAKVFQGGDEGRLLQTARSMFQRAKLFKPGASRKESFETYLVCISRR